MSVLRLCYCVVDYGSNLRTKQKQCKYFFIYRDIFIFSGRCKLCKCLYSLGVIANKIISRTAVSSASESTADSEFTAHP